MLSMLVLGVSCFYGLANAQSSSLLQDDWLKGIGTEAYDRTHRADSVIPVLESLVEDTALQPGTSQWLVLRTALACAYVNQGQYSRAAGILIEVIPGFKSLDDKRAVGFVNHWLSQSYKLLDQYDKAEHYAREALHWYAAAGWPEGQSDALNALGNAMVKQGVLDSAMAYYNLSAERALQIDYKNGVARAYNNVGNIYLTRKDYAQAIQYYEQAISVSRAVSPEAPSFFLNNLGNAYLASGDAQKALTYVQAALDSAGPSPDRSLFVNIQFNLGRVCAALGDYERAFHAIDTLNQLNQEILNQRNFAALADKEAYYQTVAKQQEITLLKSLNDLQELELARSTDRRNILIATVVTLLIIAGLGWLAYRNKRISSKLLADQKNRVELMNSLLEDKVRERTEALSQVNAELDNLLYRSSHDLRSPITNLQGLHMMLSQESDPQVIRKLIAHLGASLSSLDKLNLSICEAGNIRIHTPQLSQVSLPDFVQEVIQNMSKVQINLITVGTVCTVMADTWLLNIALDEVLQNASDALHGAPVEVTLSCMSAGNNYEIRLSDNGPGVPEAVRTTLFDLFSKGTNASSRHGIGLYKARLAVQKMGGSIELESSTTEGAVFKLVLPQPAFS